MTNNVGLKKAINPFGSSERFDSHFLILEVNGFLFLLRFLFFVDLLQGLECIHGKIVFDLAGILTGSFIIDAEKDEQFMENLMSVVDFLGDGIAGRSQIENLFGSDRDIAFIFQFLQGNGNGCLGKMHGIGDIDGMDIGVSLFLKHQDSFQVVFSGFVCVGVFHTCLLSGV